MVTPQSQSTLCPQLRTTSPRGPWTDTPEIMIKVNPTSFEVALSQVLLAMVEMQTTLITTMIDTAFRDEESDRRCWGGKSLGPMGMSRRAFRTYSRPQGITQDPHSGHQVSANGMSCSGLIIFCIRSRTAVGHYSRLPRTLSHDQQNPLPYRVNLLFYLVL